jgi:hypothetical protein
MSKRRRWIGIVGVVVGVVYWGCTQSSCVKEQGYEPNTHSVLSPAIRPLLSTLDSVKIDEQFEWEPWIAAQTSLGAQTLLDGVQANPERVEEFVAALGHSPLSDVCWMFSWTDMLFPASVATSSLSPQAQKDPEVMKWVMEGEARELVLIDAINKRLLSDGKFRRDYFRIAFWLGRWTGGGPAYRENIRIYVAPRLTELAEMHPSNFQASDHPYVAARLLRRFMFLLYLTGQEDYIARLRKEHAKSVFLDWRDNCYEKTMEHLEDCPNFIWPCDWPYGCGPDMRGPKTPVAGICFPEANRLLYFPTDPFLDPTDSYLTKWRAKRDGCE